MAGQRNTDNRSAEIRDMVGLFSAEDVRQAYLLGLVPQNTQVSASRIFCSRRRLQMSSRGRWPIAAPRIWTVFGGGLPHGIGQRQEVIRIGRLRLFRDGEPQHFPSSRNRQTVRVIGAEVITVRFGVKRERAKDRSGIGVDIRQCCNCCLRAH